MFVELHYPDSLTAQELDNYLAKGWFRMGLSIFTTNFLRFHDRFYSAIWLRIDLNTFEKSKNQLKLEKLNNKFRIEVREANPSSEHEELFSKYREMMKFEPAPTVRRLLGYQENHSSLRIYDTFEINIYDAEKLIGTGFFDLGEKSAEGISCFYDPAYKKYSLGKYLMYLKINFCKENNFRFFYPGYFAPGYQLFDYKLDLARPSLEYLDFTNDKWLNFENFSPEKAPANLMSQKLRDLSNLLTIRYIKNEFKYYDFFDADMIQNLNGLGLFDYPMFIFCFDLDEAPPLLPMVIYDIRQHQFHLILCSKSYKSVFEESLPEHYNAYLLQISRFLYTGESAEEIAEVIEMYGRELASIS